MNRTLLSLSLVAALSAGGAAGWLLRGVIEEKAAAENHSVRTEPAAPEVPKNADTAEAASPLAAAPPTPAPEPIPAGFVGFKTGEPIPLPPGASQAEAGAEPGEGASRLTIDLAIAAEEGVVAAEFRGNARDRLRLVVINRTSQPLRLSIPAGQPFAGTHGTVITPRGQLFDFAPGETRFETLPTLATASTNRVQEGAMALGSDVPQKLQGLLDYLAGHPEVTLPAAQTAALAILENLPAGAFASFAEAGGDLPNPWDTAAFKVEVVDLVGALIVLRQIGIPDEQLAITIDPQTRIEAMIDPLARALAMQYYGIAPQAEWAYWKRELLEGEPSTRHYALHGIARYFPDVAIPMLPAWARETRTAPVFRRVAIQALAETRRPEALDALRKLEVELSGEPELAKSAHDAVAYLETALNRAAPESRPIAFRVAQSALPVPAPISEAEGSKTPETAGEPFSEHVGEHSGERPNELLEESANESEVKNETEDAPEMADRADNSAAEDVTEAPREPESKGAGSGE